MSAIREKKELAEAVAAETLAWRIVDEALAYHRKPGRDLTPADALNRLFARHVRRERLRGMPRLGRETCAISLEAWPTSELRTLVPWHRRAQPRFEHYPIVVVRCGQRTFVLDGNNRTNKWIADDAHRRRSVIVIRPLFAAAQAPSPRWWLDAWRPVFERIWNPLNATLARK